jgi:lipopolysaccharide/colanic/teichoic acid biosynthesis glycosyltransferase
MRIVIAGASGFIGTQIAPLLMEDGHELVLAGRDSAALQSKFPGMTCCSYDELDGAARGFDLFVNLAVLNNDQHAGLDEFLKVNEGLARTLAETSAQLGIRTFVNVSSTHALSARNVHPYAVSKRRGAAAVKAVSGIHTVNLYLPSVYGDRWAGRLAILNALPKPLARGLFSVLQALKPTLHVKKLARTISEAAIEGKDRVILTDGQMHNWFYRVARRAIDLAVAIPVLALFCWLYVLIWILVKIRSPGPGIFAQERIGRKGAVFICLKFRTMFIETKQAGTHEVSQSSVTPLGSVLRRIKFDELPQLWNVLRNEMSLIGPRPCLPSQTELVAARRAAGVLDLKPGISGYAQVNGVDMSDPEKLARWDREYLDLQCLVLDTRLALATVLGAGRGDRVAS